MLKYLICTMTSLSRALFKIWTFYHVMAIFVASLSLVSCFSSSSSPSTLDLQKDAVIASLPVNLKRLSSTDSRGKKSLSLDTVPAQSRRRQGFSITPRGCEVSGVFGTCMFVWECLKTDGKHLGMCMDGFMFGSCCIHDESKNFVDEKSIVSTRSTTITSTTSLSSTTRGIAAKRKRPTRPSKPTKPNRFITTTEIERTSETTRVISETTTSVVRKTTTITISSSVTTTRISTRSRPTRPTRPPKPEATFGAYYPSSSALIEEKLDEASEDTISSPPQSPLEEELSNTIKNTTATSSSSKPLTSERSTFSTTTSAMTPTPPNIPHAVNKRDVCGVPQARRFCPTGRIVNGSTSCYGQFPWLVSVRRTSFFGFSTTHRCGGALINEHWVATAGHCVDDLLIAKIRVRMGELDFGSSSEPEGHIELKVIKKIVHPKYNFFTYENDLALIKLERRVEFKENIIPICLPGNNDLLIGETGIVAGWGRLSNGGTLPTILQYVSVPIVSNDKCEGMFLKAGRHETIPDIFMCAGYDHGGRDSCQGDSGGPLVVRGKDGRFFLGGIISWGIGCAEPNLPGVCTRISKFREWILKRVT